MVCLNCGGTRHYHEIKAAEISLPKAETLPNDALDPIAVDGSADLPLRYGQTEPRLQTPVLPCQNGELAVRGLSGLIENPLEIS
jgi:hypothetical protein